MSLPKSWAKTHGIEKGEEVIIDVKEDGSLIIKPIKISEKKKELAIVNFTDFFEHELLGKYLLGYDVIKIVNQKRFSYDEKERIERVLKKLVGMEIVEETQNEVVVQSVLDVSSTHPAKLLQRMCIISSSMYKDIIDGILKKDNEIVKLAVSRDEEVDRIYFFLVRVLRTIIQDYWLMSEFSILPMEVMDYRLVSEKLELIGDISVDMGIRTLEAEEELINEFYKSLGKLPEIARNVSELQNEALNLFLNRRTEKVEEKLIEYESALRKLKEISESEEKISFIVFDMLQILATVKDIIDLSF
ncbi:MAG: phosphate uptake regulator PhoU [Thermoproteota archaeon]